MHQLFSSTVLLLLTLCAYSQDYSNSIVDKDLIFEEVNGLVAVEAEHFYRQSKTDIRKWYRTTKHETPKVGMDPDEPHVAGASNFAYLEILPDTRADHSQELIAGENFSNEPGKLAILHYQVFFNTPGKYYVWVRAHSTGSEDNGLHVGIYGEWPETGQRLQWCEGKQTWRWESKQRTDEEHCGEPYKIFLEITEPGLKDIQFSLREDGFEFDKFIMTTQKDFSPGNETGPESRVKTGSLPPPFPVYENGN